MSTGRMLERMICMWAPLCQTRAGVTPAECEAGLAPCPCCCARARSGGLALEEGCLAEAPVSHHAKVS